MAETIINVSNRLPVTVGEQNISKSSGGPVAALEGMGESRYTLKWLRLARILAVSPTFVSGFTK